MSIKRKKENETPQRAKMHCLQNKIHPFKIETIKLKPPQTELRVEHYHLVVQLTHINGEYGMGATGMLIHVCSTCVSVS